MTAANDLDDASGLLEIWQRLANAHSMIGAACACGAGGIVVSLGDFEQDIVDYLHGEAERLDRADILTIMEADGREGGQWSITRLLERLSRVISDEETLASAFIIQRLGRTLRSFEKLHGGR